MDQSETHQSDQSESRTKNDTLIRMESALKAEREKLQKNQAELIKLQRLAQNADVSFIFSGLVFFLYFLLRTRDRHFITPKMNQ